ncbi:MAG: hypothetical protein ACE14S_10585 [Candidatus Bathyarchaeia archaeon]
MIKTEPRTGTSNFFSKLQLIRLKRKAMRYGVWFRVLPRIDRAIIELAVRVTDRIRSPALAKIIATIAGKLEEFVESRLVRVTREIGLPLTRRLSSYAQKWGYKTAKAWAGNADFARYLAVMNLNT